MLHTSVLLSVAVLSVAAFVPPNYYNYVINNPGAPGAPGSPGGSPGGSSGGSPGGQGPQGNGNYAVGHQHGIQIQSVNASGLVAISKDASGNIRIMNKDGKIVITNCRVCRLCCIGYRLPGPGQPGESSDKYSLGPNPAGPQSPGGNPQYPERYAVQPFPFPSGPEGPQGPQQPITRGPGEESSTPQPWYTYPTTAPTAGPSTGFPWPPVPTPGPFPGHPGHPGYPGYPVPPQSENIYRTAPPTTQPTPAPCTPVTPGTTTAPSTRPPCQPQQTVAPVNPSVVYPTAPGYATSPAPTYPTAPPPTYPTAPAPTENAYATVPGTEPTAPTATPYWPMTVPTLPTVGPTAPTLPTVVPTLPTVGPTASPGTSPCCYVELRNIQATVSCGTIGTKCCHQTCSIQRTITVSVPFPIFNLPSRIPCSEAVQRGIVRESDIRGVCNTYPEQPTVTPYSPYLSTVPTLPTVGTTGYPYPPAWTPSPTGTPAPGATVVPGPSGPSDAYVVPKSSSGTLIGAFFTILVASILCL